LAALGEAGLSVLKLADETTHKRLRLGMHALRSGTVPVPAAQTGGEFAPAPGLRLRDVAFREAALGMPLVTPPRVGQAAHLSEDEIERRRQSMVAVAGLNEGQEAAIDFAMRAPEFACIHGPPGTVSAVAAPPPARSRPCVRSHLP
jgi:hypothetical protein